MHFYLGALAYVHGYPILFYPCSFQSKPSQYTDHIVDAFGEFIEWDIVIKR